MEFGGSQTVTRTLEKRQKYRDPKSKTTLPPQNIMYDRRVVRGSTYVHEMDITPSPIERPVARKVIKRRHIPRNISTPEPVEGRQHMEVQTTNYLEEISSRPAEKAQETQTDPLLDRPVSPLFMPKPSGVSVSTSIEPGDLFDFDTEVKPILEVLIGKTIEQSLMEVLEEEELKSIESHRSQFEQIRNARLAECQRLEAQELRRFEEKERRLEQEKKRLEKEEILREQLESRNIAKSFLNNLEDSVLDQLQLSGHFFDPVQREVEEIFMPWVVDKVIDQVHDSKIICEFVDSIIGESVQLAIRKHESAMQKIEDDAAEARRKLQEIENEKIRIAEAEAAEKLRLEEEANAENGENANETEDATEAGENES